jgi:hypothetical protein
MSRKHVQIFEEFDAERFLDNPEAELASASDPNQIGEGDYVDSYRGKGQVLEIVGDFARVQLEGAEGKIVKIPIFSLKKSSAPTAKVDYQMIHSEVADLADRITSYVSYLEQDPTAIDLHSAEDLLSNTLVDLISLQKQDPSITSSDEFDTIYHRSVSLADMITDVSPGRKETIDSILSKYEELGNMR